LAKDLAYARRQRLGNTRDVTHKDLFAAFEQNPKLAKMLTGNAKSAEVVKKLGRLALQRRVVLDKDEAGPRLFREVAEEVLETLEDLGIRPGENATPRKGLEALGLGDVSSPLSEEQLYQEQPPARVSVSSGNYRSNLAGRLLRRIVKAGGLRRNEGDDSIEE
jgi:hypothetical protein